MDDHIVRLADDTALWSAGMAPTNQVVGHACDALVAGLDSQALRELAGASLSSLSDDLEDLLRRVADDFDYPFYWRHSDDGRAAAARVMAKECVQGRLPPKELASWMHQAIGHAHPDGRFQALVCLDDDYDLAFLSTEELDRAVLDAARTLLEAE